jgi:hypothetical protein
MTPWQSWAMLLFAFAPAALATGGMLQQPSDLRWEAALVQRWGEPLVILFSMPDCSYCPEVRTNYLAPLARGAAGKPGPVVREIDISSTQPMRGFHGETLTAAQFSRSYKIRVSPTVLMLDQDGTVLTEPLVGSGMGGFYGAYLDRALQSAQALLQSRRKAGVQ